MFIFSNCVKEKNKIGDLHYKVIATLDRENVYLSQIDSIIGMQIYEQRLNTLQMFVAREILKKEAKKNNVTLNQFVEKQINEKCKEVTNQDFDTYISQNNISFVDTTNIILYLKNIKRKDRQKELIDSLKQYYAIRIKLQPPYFNHIETNDIYSLKINQNKSHVEVLIISDFNCPSCQNAENQLEKLYKKYNNKVVFKFVYFSAYISKSALACEAAARQNKFKEMHDIIFENINLLNEDSIYGFFATKLGLKIDKFNKVMNDQQILKLFVENKERLISKGIYSTPTFVVNGKVLDKRHSIDYLEDVIVEELEKQ